MKTSMPHHAPILPVPDDLPRPLWSVMIPTYNCTGYLRETLASVLAQDPGPELMQIEVVDDHSTQDDPEALVAEMGRGRVTFYQQPNNVGHVRNFDTCLQRSRGQLIHILHGDDYVRAGFYARLQGAFAANSEIGAAFCRHIYMDRHGHWQSITPLESPVSGVLTNWLQRIAVEQRIQAPSIVVRRDVYEQLGGFDRRIRSYGEDWEMWVRIAAQYPIWFEVEPLAVYRLSSQGSLTEHAMKTRTDNQDLHLVIQVISTYLETRFPSAVARQLTRQARQACAGWALEVARELLLSNDVNAVRARLQDALQFSHSWPILRKALSLYLHIWPKVLTGK